MSWSHVGGTTATNAGSAVTSIAATYTVSAAGNLLVARLAISNPATTVEISDTQDNDYAPLIDSLDITGLEGGIWAAIAGSSGSTTFTATMNEATYPSLLIDEYSYPGLVSWSTDGFSQSTPGGTTSSSPASGNFTTANANDLLLGLITTGAASSLSGETSGWNLRGSEAYSNGHAIGAYGLDQLGPAAGTYNAGGTLSGSVLWDAMAVAITPSTTPSFLVSPSTGLGGTAVSVTLTGLGTSWESYTASTLFTASAGTISGTTVSSNTSATFTLTLPGANETVTITDTSTGATATIVSDGYGSLRIVGNWYAETATTTFLSGLATCSLSFFIKVNSYDLPNNSAACIILQPNFGGSVFVGSFQTSGNVSTTAIQYSMAGANSTLV